MATIEDYRNEQLEKQKALRELGVNLYPSKSYRDTAVGDIVVAADDFFDKGVCVAGRLMSQREHGGVQFLDIIDGSDMIQIIVREKSLTAQYPKGLLGYKDLSYLTRGDFIEIAGVVARSERGELSVEAKGLRILTKVLRPLPQKLDDKETRLRRRYLDIAINNNVRERFVRRSIFWQSIRDFLNNEDFLEINTPILEHTTGGADANPFVTHMDALGEDFYLRISHELPLKRLLGAGYEKVYDLGPRFRNENYTDEHLPEHVALEWYWAYADWRDGMEQVRRMFIDFAQNTWGRTKFEWEGQTVDLEGEWQEWDYAEVIQKHYGIDVFNCTIDQVSEQLKKHQIEVEKTDSIPRGIDKLWKKIRADVAGPVFLTNTPTFISPLSKPHADNPEKTERFQLVMFGSELVNCFSELNDPVDQLNKFVQQQMMRDDGDDEAMMLDIDFVEMLEYGMPPACGFGISERIFWLLEGVTAREGVIFPQLRQEVSEQTRNVYPEVYGLEGLEAKSGAGREQDLSKRIVAVVRKDLENWEVANACSHMSAYHAHKMAKDEFDSGEFFMTRDGHKIPRNSQHPILIKRADKKELFKLYNKAKEAGVRVHVFIKTMIDTNSDNEIVEALKEKDFADLDIYGLALFGDNDSVNSLTKHFQLWN